MSSSHPSATRTPRIGRKRNPALVAAMARAGLNNRLLAQAAGLSPATIGAIINLRVVPSLPTAQKLAAALGSTVETLFGSETGRAQ